MSSVAASVEPSTNVSCEGQLEDGSSCKKEHCFEIKPSDEDALKCTAAPNLSEGSPSPVTILRIKRRIQDDPKELLVLSYKRMRKENDPSTSTLEPPVPVGSNSDNEIKSVLRLAGSHNDDQVNGKILDTFCARSTFPDISRQKCVKSRSFKPASVARSDFRERLNERRFKVISAIRDRATALSDSNIKNEDPEISEDKRFKLYDLVAEEFDKSESGSRNHIESEMNTSSAITCNGVPMIRESVSFSKSNELLEATENALYTYDFYVTQDFDLHDDIIDQSVHVKDAYQDSLFVDYRRDGSDSEASALNDEDDSNDEDNWRNDYPDTDSEFDDCDKSQRSEDSLDEHFSDFDIQDNDDYF